MSSDISLLTAAVTIVFGALAGGLTNAVAIWMLFHPYTPRGPWRFKLHGAIPKNKARLAKTIGRTVGQRLLTADDLASQLAAPELRAAFDNAIGGLIGTVLDTDRGSLRQELPTGLLREVEGVLAQIAPSIAQQLADFVKTEDFNTAVAGFLTHIGEDLGDRPLSDFLTEERRASIRSRIETWVGEAVMNPELEKTIENWLDRQLVSWSGDQTPMLERFPTAIVDAVEKEIAGYLPVALDRIGAALRDPKTRSNIQQSLHGLFEGFVKNLLIHERIVARIVVTEKTIARLLDNFERDGADQMSRLLDEPEMRDQVAKGVNEAMVKFLRRPLADHLAALGPERLEGIKHIAVHHITAALRDSATRTYAIEKVGHALENAEKYSVSEIIKRLPPKDAANWTAAAIASERVREWIEQGTTAALNALLDKPIGRPADRLPEGSSTRIIAALSPILWEWMQQQVPELVGRVDIQAVVEEKVAGFSLERIEQIVRATTQRELDLIVRLGYVLGAVVGAVAYLVTVVLSMIR
ncbi:MAG: DUF445 family protein [Gemmatimonadetes bacterium]|nr:DUF445 family protein [Gemmatimonadota bacterium]